MLWLAFRRQANVAIWLAGLLAASFAINIALSVNNLEADFYLPFSRFWELLAGAGLAWMNHTRPTGPYWLANPTTRSWLSVGGLTCLAASIALYDPAMRFPGWPALMPVLGTVAVILAGPQAFVNRHLLSTRAAVQVGLISYPLYIWHWPLLSYATIVRMGKGPTPLMAAALVIVSVGLAWLTWRFVERPLRYNHKVHAVLLLSIAMGGAGAAGLALWTSGGLPGRFPSLAGIDVGRISAASADPIFKPTTGMQVTNYDETLVTRIGNGNDIVLLSGDSLLFHYGPRVQRLADEGLLTSRVVFVTGASCPPVPGVIQRDQFAHCRNLPGLVSELVTRDRVRTLILGASWLGYGDATKQVERGDRRFTLDSPEGKDAFFANLEDFIRQFRSAGIEVYLILSVPTHQRFNPRYMISRTLSGVRVSPDATKAIAMDDLRAPLTAVNDRLRAIAMRTGAHTLDPLPAVCGVGDGCSPFFREGEPKFSDSMHLRPLFVQEHLRFLDPLLTKARD